MSFGIRMTKVLRPVLLIPVFPCASHLNFLSLILENGDANTYFTGFYGDQRLIMNIQH